MLWWPSTARHRIVVPGGTVRVFGLHTYRTPLKMPRTPTVAALAWPADPRRTSADRESAAMLLFVGPIALSFRVGGSTGRSETRIAARRTRRLQLLVAEGMERMGGNENDRTPALQEAARRRRTLHEALVALEVAISSPAAGRIPDWTRKVTKEMTAVRDAWDEHIDGTETPGGLYEEIVGMSPRLAGTVDRLRDEHPDITEAVGQMLARVEQVEVGGLTWPLDDARDDLQRLIGRVIRHRQKGADLVWEAYNVDIGGPE